MDLPSPLETAMPSPADAQIEAIADVERITRAFVVETGLNPANARRAVERLLRQDVIRVGRRPNVERPMEGQVSLLEEVCDHVWETGNDECLHKCGARYSELFGNG
jgi:hypothetical protein